MMRVMHCRKNNTGIAIILLEVFALLQSQNANGFSTLFHQRSSYINAHTDVQRHPRSTRASTLNSSASDQEAQKLLEKAAEIRKQLAELEGKTLSQVEKEAQEEKEMRSQLQLESQTKHDLKNETNKRKKRSMNNPLVYVPETIDDQIRQASLAIERAFEDGITRQTVRLALVKQNEMITPEEEEWPGGSMQMYREAGRPLTEALLSEVRAVAKNIQSEEEKSSGKENYPPTIKAQDIWDFDGSAIITAEAASGPSGDVQALVFPNTDAKYLKDIAEIDSTFGKDRLFLLINPFWRNVESWGFNILQPKAKQKAQEILFDNEHGAYQETYVLSRFSVRGEDCVALKVYPNDWELFAYLEDYSYGGPMQTTIRLGSSEEEPKSSTFAKLLNERDEFKMNKTMRQLNKKF